jgi:CDP-diacylglycerol pyrophosphatase
LALAVLEAWAADPQRGALWQVVRACLADYRLTGRAFPCLDVELAGGEERGHVILRPPFGPPDTVLAPTRRIEGVEDAWLQSPAAPNYFEAAWEARSFLPNVDGRAPPRETIALAVNSRSGRSQDQLHIHIGCQTQEMRRILLAFASGLKIDSWTRIGAVTPGSELWALRVPQPDLAGVKPFRLAAEGLADMVKNRARLTIAVAGVRVEDRDEVVILAADAGEPGQGGQVAAEQLVDPACASRPVDFGSD